MSDLVLNLLIKASSSSATSGIRGVASELLGVGGAGGLVAGILMKVGETAIEVGVKSTEMAGTFQTAALSLVAHADLAKSQMDNVSQSVLAMSSQVGRTPVQLEEALYPILSAFSGIQNQAQKSSLSLLTLKDSFEAVAGTTVDGTAVAKAAVQTFNSLGYGAANVTDKAGKMQAIFDVMDKTVQLGNMTWDDYKSAVSKVALSIQGTNVTFNESQAALAEMTNHGFPSAQKASTYFANAMGTLEIKTNVLAAHAKKLGISFDLAKYGPMTLGQKLEYLNTITDGNKQKLLALMGNNRTALATYNALTSGIGDYNSNLNTLNHSQGALQASFDTASQGMQFAWSRVKAGLDAVMIALGTKLLPILTSVANYVAPLVAAFAAWIVSSDGASKSLSGVGSVLQQVGGLFAFMSGQVAHYTLDMQEQSAQHTLDTAKQTVANFAQQAQGVEEQMQHVHTSVARHALQAKLTAIQHAQAQAQGVVDQYSKQVDGIKTQLDRLNPQVALHTLQAKDTAVSNTIAMSKQTIAKYGEMRAGLVTELSHTTDETKRDAIKRQIAAIDAATKQKEGVLKQAEQTKTGIETQMKGIHASMTKMGSNPLVLTWQAVQTAALAVWNYLSKIDWGGIWKTLVSGAQSVWKMLQQVGGFLAANFAPVWQQLVTMWRTQLLPLFTQIYTAIIPMLPLFKGIAGLLILGIIGALAGAIKGIAGFLSGLIVVITGVVRIVTGAMQVLGGIIGFFTDLFTGHFDKLGSDLGMIWQGIINIFTGAWQVIAGVFQTAWYTISGLVTGFVDGIKGAFTALSNDLVGHSIIPDMINSIVSWFTQLVPRAIAAVQGLVGQLGGFFSGLAGQAISWGQGLINGFIQGIKNAAGGVTSAVSGIIQNVKNFMGFHSPAKMGPGSDADQWGPNLVKMFARDIASNSGKAQQAAEGMMSGVLKAVQKYQILVLQAEHDGNTKLATEYKTQESYLKQQAAMYATIAKQAGDKINANNLNNPILFKATTGVLNGPSSGSTSSSGTGTGSTSNPTYQIINNNTVEIKPTIMVPQGYTKQDLQKLVNDLDVEWAKKYRRQGINIPNSSGVAA